MSKTGFLFLIFSLSITPALASAPVPVKKQSIEELNADLKIQQEHKKELEQKARVIEGEISDIRDDLVKTAGLVQKSEDTLGKLEKNIKSLENEKAELHEEFEKDRKQISHLVLALQRIARVPPQALIMRPGAPLETAQSALLMSDIIPALQKQSNALKENMARLDVVSDELETKKIEAVKTNDGLQKEQNKLTSLVSKKEDLYKETNMDLKAQQQTIERISLQAKNLSDLMIKLQQNQEEERTRNMKAQRVFKPDTTLPGLGKTQLPVPGAITVAYNEPDAFGAPSEGITIEGRSGALVVAPMGGIVRFAGQFKNYGNMIIIEHKNNYHSLIAGFEKIDTLVGQKISGGEPVGTLQKSLANKKPRLYYELRFDGKPVDPAQKFSEIRS